MEIKKLNIKEVDGINQFIGVDKIRRELKANDKLSLVFESGKTDDEYRKLLQKEFAKYHVFNVRWIPEIWIHPAIETDKILEVKDEVYQAAISFREDGIQLMKTLGKTYQINPFEGDELFELRRKSMVNKQRGKVNEEWNFFFHGGECQFENHKTGQIVELIITNGSEFGALDKFYFLRYLKTTLRFKELADFFSEDSSSITKALNLLEDLGKLERISEFSQRGIIAK